MAEKKSSRNRYNCLKCPAYCCSYQHIPVTDKDIKRLAKHFGLTEAQAKKRFTKKGDEESPRVLRHKDDEHFTTICRFIDSETRNCTIYHARPEICRDFPSQKRCGYYDFLTFERAVQDDPDWIATTD
ncbi:YkgJ family cysteine cluster protein [Parvularcula marina]|uniref:YkgJ family cysteine cluster protein n=1 Tax=Parvularcula marina TaxID=2292771 RepID=A0A371R7N6_9PROT|nr:YkgJ family cysteine cluster protein [Parvularcula marina]RFB01472.1 YkgJ family cysteine cluster protein [Parvularcula marina]